MQDLYGTGAAWLSWAVVAVLLVALYAGWLKARKTTTIERRTITLVDPRRARQ